MAISGGDRQLRPEVAATFVVSVAVTMIYALRGGSFDVVVRHEHGLVVWWVVGLGAALALLRNGWLTWWRLLPAIGLLLLAAWTGLGALWGESGERAHVEAARVIHHAGVVVLVCLVVTRRTWRPAAGGLVTGMVVVCAIAVASRLAPGAFPLDEVRDEFGTTRLNYPLNYWNAVSAWAAMAAVMSLGWSTQERNLAIRAVALASVPICLTAAYLTYSRAGIGGLGIGLIILLVVARGRLVVLLHAIGAGALTYLPVSAVRSNQEIASASGDAGASDVVLMLLVAAMAAAGLAVLSAALARRRAVELPPRVGRKVAGAATVLAVVVGALALSEPVSTGWEQFTDVENTVPTQSATDPSQRLSNLNGNRYNIWRVAWRGFRAEPVQGTGPGTYEYWWNAQAVHPEFLRDGHSLYLETAAELGLIGVLLLLVTLGGGVAAGVACSARSSSSGQLSVAVALCGGLGAWLFHLGVDWIWESTAVAVAGLAIVGLLAVGAGSDEPRPSLVPRLAIVVVAVLAFLVQIPVLAGMSNVRASQRAAAAGDLTEASAAADDAVAAWPWAATPLVQRALVAEASGRLAQAENDLETVIAREPDDWRHPLLLASVRARRGDTSGALDAYRQAKRLRPLGGFFRD